MAPTGSVQQVFGDGSYVFDFMVRIAGGAVRLGLGVAHNDGDTHLTVQDVMAGGAIAAWDKQCANSPAAVKVVLPGDKILKVNETTGPDIMLYEVRNKNLLRITMARGSHADVASFGQQVWHPGPHGQQMSQASAEWQAAMNALQVPAPVAAAASSTSAEWQAAMNALPVPPPVAAAASTEVESAVPSPP